MQHQLRASIYLPITLFSSNVGAIHVYPEESGPARQSVRRGIAHEQLMSCSYISHLRWGELPPPFPVRLLVRRARRGQGVVFLKCCHFGHNTQKVWEIMLINHLF